MKTVGTFATVLGGMVFAFGAVILIRSIPEMKRYMNIRKM